MSRINYITTLYDYILSQSIINDTPKIIDIDKKDNNNYLPAIHAFEEYWRLTDYQPEYNYTKILNCTISK